MRIRTQQNTNTISRNNESSPLLDPLYMQIIDVLGNKELSFQELSHSLPADEERVSHDVNTLVRAGIVSRRFGHNHIAYTLTKHALSQFLSKLHRIEDEGTN